MGNAGKHGGSPAERRDKGNPAEVGEGQQVEGMADCQVALHGEGDNGEDAGIGSAVAKDCFWFLATPHLSERKLLKLQKMLPKGQGY